MQWIYLFVSAATLVVASSDILCNHDNCYRALAQYQRTSSSLFCSQYLSTSTKQVPGSIATCGSTRISSACSCLSTSKPTSTKTATQTPTSTFNTSTCVHSSIAACPTSYDPCCAYKCGEAQVPFDVCSPNDETGQFASCSPCPKPPKSSAPSTTPTTTPSPTTTLNTSTCSPKSISACPTAYDPCCGYICAEAQVPFEVCSPNDRTGQFASCSKCSSPTAKPTA